MDWLLGRYAEAELAGMDETVLSVFEQLLEQSDPDLNSWILDPEKLDDQLFQPLILALRSFHGLDDPASKGLT
jgi:antitoxin CptB